MDLFVYSVDLDWSSCLSLWNWIVSAKSSFLVGAGSECTDDCSVHFVSILSILCLGNYKQLKQRWILSIKSYFKLIIVKFGIVIFDDWTLQRIVKLPKNSTNLSQLVAEFCDIRVNSKKRLLLKTKDQQLESVSV